MTVNAILLIIRPLVKYLKRLTELGRHMATNHFIYVDHANFIYRMADGR